MAAREVPVAKRPFHLFHAFVADDVFLLGMNHQIAVKGFDVTDGFQRDLIFTGIIGDHQRGGVLFLAARNKLVQL